MQWLEATLGAMVGALGWLVVRFVRKVDLLEREKVGRDELVKAMDRIDKHVGRLYEKLDEHAKAAQTHAEKQTEVNLQVMRALGRLDGQ